MTKQFREDLKKAKYSERVVLEVLRNCSDDWYFFDISDFDYCHLLGDIEAWSLEAGSVYIDTKCDGLIHRTGNILAEDKIIFKYNGTAEKGFMQKCQYDYMAIISIPAKKIYIIDFRLLKKYYKSGAPIVSEHEEQDTHGYLFPLWKARDYGILKMVIHYDYDKENGYYPTNIKNLTE